MSEPRRRRRGGLLARLRAAVQGHGAVDAGTPEPPPRPDGHTSERLDEALARLREQVPASNGDTPAEASADGEAEASR